MDEFADSTEADRERYFARKGVSLESSPKQRISLPGDVIGVEVLTGFPSGGRSRRVYILADGVGYTIDCESAENWEKLQPFFTRIISSFTLEKKR